ncbi:MAG: YigZ family protein [Lachnospira sp.]
MKIILNSGCEAEIVEKKSRFIANLYRIESEEQAVGIINALRKKYWDARHNCYAYILGEKQEIKKFSDDGEPAGTAGKPMLDVLENSNLTDCLVVVTRYFGGVLLGTGGLVRAYQGATRAGLETANVVEVVEGISLRVDVDYNFLGKLQYICRELGIRITDTLYEDNVKNFMIMTKDIHGRFLAKLADAFSGTVEVYETAVIRICKNEDGEIFTLDN